MLCAMINCLSDVECDEMSGSDAHEHSLINRVPATPEHLNAMNPMNAMNAIIARVKP